MTPTQTNIQCRNCHSEITNTIGLLSLEYSPYSLAKFESTIYYCNECTTTCSCCDDKILFDDSRSYNDDIYCDSCFNDSYFICDRCGETHSNDYMYNAFDNSYCQDCFEQYYFICQNCDETHSRANYYGNGQCNDCNEDQRIIHNTDYKPRPKFYGKGLHSGVEIEIDNGRNFDALTKELHEMSEDSNLFYMKPDGSLDNGLEIVSHPMSLDFHKNNMAWNKIMRKCLKHGWRSHNAYRERGDGKEYTCGLHIHVGKNHFTHSEKIKLAIFINTNKCYIEKIARRKSNLYHAYKHIEKGKVRDSNRNYNSRYESLNWYNRNTIEFRMFRGTLKYNTFIATLEFVNAVCYFVKTINVHQVYNENYINNQWTNGKAWRLFCKYIICNHKQYSTLIKYMRKRGVFICV